MKKTPSASFLDLRKEQLHREIIEATEVKNYQTLSLLKFQWAHRYGVETFPEIEENGDTQNSKTFPPEVSQDSPSVVQDLVEIDNSHLIPIPALELEESN